MDSRRNIARARNFRAVRTRRLHVSPDARHCRAFVKVAGETLVRARLICYILVIAPARGKSPASIPAVVAELVDALA